MKKIIIIFLTITIPLMAQNITNKLGGTSDSETYDITDSNNKLLFQVTGQGRVGIGTTAYDETLHVNGGSIFWGLLDVRNSSDNTLFKVWDSGKVGINSSGPDELFDVNGNMRLYGALVDKEADYGTSGQILSSTGTAIDWINSPSNVTVITTRTATLSAGERALNTYAGGTTWNNTIDFTIPNAASSSDKSIEVFIGRADINPGIRFSQAVTVVGTNLAYSGNNFFQLRDQYEGIITLVSDGTIWRGFGLVYGGTVNPCFIAGTKIALADGNGKNIEDIKVGDLVASCDLLTGQIVNKKVTKTFANPVKKGLVEITFSNGTKNTNTLDHRYFVVNKGWCAVKPNIKADIESGQLKIGDSCLVLQDGQPIELKIEKIELKNRLKLRTYNFTVEDTECYFANGILVHNRY